MKRLFALILALLLLAGCGGENSPTLPPTEPTQPQPTEPPVPWIEEKGMQWDEEGVLLEIPLTIPDGFHYNSAAGFDGDLLLWSIDDHLKDIVTIDLCTVELDDGSVIAQREFPLRGYVVPQMLGDSLYLCDNTGGQVLRLNKSLETVEEWKTEPAETNWYMGDGGMLYQLVDEKSLVVLDLASGESRPVMEGDPEISWISDERGQMTIEYFRADTGAKELAVLDLMTGDIFNPDMGSGFSTASLVNGNWLCGKYITGYVYYLSVDGGAPVRLSGEATQFSLLREGYILAENTELRLYNLDGSLVSSAFAIPSGNGYVGRDLIWNESLGGYFFLVHRFDDNSRLLFWDITKSAGGNDLEMEPVPAEDEIQLTLRRRAEEIGQHYGLTILVGEQCDTVFDEFTASQVTDLDRVLAALDTLEEALSAFPDGFIRQLRYDNVRGIRIQLVCDLWADGGGRQGDGYAAFTQAQWDNYLMVIDIDDSMTQTYYHEFSHIIDAYLQWDAGQRDDALFSEQTWNSLNPGWFTGYTYDYGREHDMQDYKSFVDGYSTIKPTEDRARVLEYAMGEAEWTFTNAPGLRRKLDYYSRCIRDAFDTTGWPEKTIWEETLSRA